MNVTMLPTSSWPGSTRQSTDPRVTPGAGGSVVAFLGALASWWFEASQRAGTVGPLGRRAGE